MNTASQIELALKKQRLQLDNARLRHDLARHGASLAPAFAAVDRVVDGAVWLRRHPEWVVAVTVVFAVARPRRAWRWARRAFLGWQAWRRVQAFLAPRRPT